MYVYIPVNRFVASNRTSIAILNDGADMCVEVEVLLLSSKFMHGRFCGSENDYSLDIFHISTSNVNDQLHKLAHLKTL